LVAYVALEQKSLKTPELNQFQNSGTTLAFLTRQLPETVMDCGKTKRSWSCSLWYWWILFFGCSPKKNWEIL